MPFPTSSVLPVFSVFLKNIIVAAQNEAIRFCLINISNNFLIACYLGAYITFTTFQVHNSQVDDDFVIYNKEINTNMSRELQFFSEKNGRMP